MSNEDRATEDNEPLAVIVKELLREYGTEYDASLLTSDFGDDAQRILDPLAAEGYTVVKGKPAHFIYAALGATSNPKPMRSLRSPRVFYEDGPWESVPSAEAQRGDLNG
jgi:hypothetical protein